MKRKILAVIFGVIMGLVAVINVKALENDSTLQTQYIDNVYAYHYKNGVLMSYGKLPYRYQNNKLSYCIEPWYVISTSVYSSTDDWTLSGYTEEEKLRMELISHYGYGYEGHNTLEYYMATQELIWLFKDDYVKWTNQYSVDAPSISVENEKNEILRLVNLHNTSPSFANSCYNNYLGDELKLTDTNSVLDNFDITSNLNYVKNGNTLTFNIDKLGEYKIDLVSKNKTNDTTKVYYSSSSTSQKMVSLGFSDSKSYTVTINVDKVRVRINKRDANSKNLILDVGTVFKVKNVDTDSYVEEQLIVSEDGYAYIDLEKGTYEIQEISASTGYVINSDNIIIEINDDTPIVNSYYDVDIYNDVPKGKIEIEKVDEDDNNIYGVEIGLYNSDYELIDTLVTGDNNFFSDLELGTYYVKELDTLNGYILDDKYYKVQLDYVDDHTYVVEETVKIVNKKIKCDIVYISSSDNEKLKGVEINVYDSNNKVVFSGKTDENGEVVINDLTYGTYYIKQIKVPKGYVLNEEEYTFYVNDSTCVGKINVTNEKTVMPITSTGINKCFGLFIILSFLGVYNFVKKSS